MKQLRHVLGAIGARRAGAILWPVVPIALIEVATLMLIRAFFLMLQGIGGAPLPFAFDDPVAGALTLGAGLVLYLVLRAVLVNVLWHRVVARAAAAQAAIADRLFTAYLGQSEADRRRGSRSAERKTLLLAATGMFHQVLLPALMLVAEGLVAAAILLVLVIAEPLATLAVALWLALLYGALSAFSARFSTRAGQRRWTALERLRRIADGALGDSRWVRLTGSEAAFARLHSEAGAEHAAAVALDRTLALAPRYTLELAMVTVLLLLTLVFSAMGREGAALLGDLLLFAAAAIRLLPAAQRLTALAHGLRAHAPDLAQVRRDLALKVEALATPPIAEGPPFRRELRAEALRFAHAGEEAPLLDGLSLTLGTGERVAISGPSGAGKSTLLSLLLGLLRPDGGRILLDGEAVPVLDRMRRSRVALAPQDPFVLDASLGANIAFPEPPEALDEGRAAALLAALGLPQSLDTAAGEAGGLISGGERQRLAIARALYRRPEFLILDEATSQLDPAAEARVFEAIRTACPGATVLVVAHRPLPDGFATRRLVLRDGRLSPAP